MRMTHYANDARHYIGAFFEANPFPGAIAVPHPPATPGWLWDGQTWIAPPPGPATVSMVSGDGIHPDIIAGFQILTAEVQKQQQLAADLHIRTAQLEDANAQLHKMAAATLQSSAAETLTGKVSPNG